MRNASLPGCNETLGSVNWLAHVFLSEPDGEARLGQVLADWVKGDARAQFSARIQRGMACHVTIDRFTDSHPIVTRSLARIQSPFKRYAGVLVDVFYDHLLTCHWARYHAGTLRAFVDDVYTGFAAHLPLLPPRARTGFEHMIADDWLGSYGTIQGVEVLLRRISSRLSRANGLGEGAIELLAHHDGFEKDFLEYFPQVQSHVRIWIAGHPITP